jgi:hypothetical protein
VIEPAKAIDARGDVGSFQTRDNFGRNGGLPGCRIAKFIKLSREAAEIVNRFRSRASAQHRYRRFPVRGRDQHCAWARQLAAEVRPGAPRDARVDGVHGRPVRQENRGQRHQAQLRMGFFARTVADITLSKLKRQLDLRA